MSHFIVIEGLIGVGKTSLCRILEKEWGARLILEPWEHNPFLAAFYSDRERYAFPAQMFYLASRFAQQQQLQQTDLFSDLIISDYLYAKDRLFAQETLNSDELALYDRFSRLLAGSIPRPDFVLFLDAPTEVIQRRIARRSIAAEQGISSEYLDSLRRRYYALWASYQGAPVYILDTTDIDYVDRPEDRTHILSMIEGWMKGVPLLGAPRAWSPPTPDQVPLFP
jgi:deoxyadenosine/deoxycytidine kinase